MLYYIKLEIKNKSKKDVVKVAHGCIGAVIVGRHIVIATKVEHKVGEYYYLTLITNLPQKIADKIRDIKLQSFLEDDVKIGKVRLISVDKKEKKAMVKIIVL